MEENHAYNEIIGSSSAPYINNLAGQGALMTNSFAIEHPSEPNYLDIFSGSNQGITYDGYDNPGAFPGPDLAGEAIGAGLSFGAYIEDYPGGYDHDHAPWDLFSDVPSSTEKDYASNWPTDYTTLPTISIVTPNLTDDMHDGTIRQGDTWLQNNIDSYAQWAKTHNSLLIVQWDEDDGTESNQVATIFVGQMVNPGTYGESINHFNVLRTIEDMYGLPYAGQSASVNPISDIWTSSPPPAASSFQVSGFPSPTTAGQSGSFTVTALDSSGHVATGYTGTVHFTSSDGHATLPADYTFTSTDQGVHTFNATLATAGSQSITATDTTSGSVTGSQTGITVNPGTASVLAVVGFPSSITVGQSGNFTVTAQDSYGNTATGYTGTVHFTSSVSSASLPGDYTFTSTDQGTRSFSATFNTAGSQSLTATDTADSTITGSQTGITVNPANPAHSFRVNGFPSPTTAGVSHSFTVTALDSSGHVATGYTGTVHFSSNDSQAVLPADYIFTTGDQGVHTFTATLEKAGSRSITARDTSDGSVTGSQTSIRVHAAAISQLGVAFPSPTTAGVGHNLVITAEDPYGNRVSSYRGTIHFTSSDAQAHLPADYTFTSSDKGAHTFWGNLKTAGTQSITATDTSHGSITGTDAGIVVNPAAASRLTVAGFPSPIAAGTAGSFTVTAIDAYGNTATGYTGTVHFTSSDSSAALPADYTYTAGDAGVHTFSATLNTAGTQSITATDTVTGSINGTQSGITVTAGGGGATWHYAPNSNFVNNQYAPGADGFNMADVSSVSDLSMLPAGDKALVWLGMHDGVTSAFINAVTPFIGDSRVYGFYLDDEPDPTVIPAANFKAEADWIHANDPGAITFITLMNMGTDTNPTYQNTYNSANTDIDLFGLDPYPVQTQFGGANYSIIGAAVSAAEAWGITQSQIVPVFQTFGGGGYSNWILPTASQEQQILSTWAGLIPNPAFDYAYSWGIQNSDSALVNSPDLQSVLAAHNA
jgi:hypothetical protein